MRKVGAICAIMAYLIVFNYNRPNYEWEHKSTSETTINAMTSVNKLKESKVIHIFDIPKGLSKSDLKINYIEVTPKYSKQDLYELTAAIYQEAGGDKYQDITRLLVGNVVLNRVEHKDYSNSIHDVLTAKKQYGNMWRYGIHIPNTTNEIELNAIERSKQAAIRLLNGERFCPNNVVFESEFSWLGDGTYKYIDGLYFNYKK